MPTLGGSQSDQELLSRLAISAPFLDECDCCLCIGVIGPRLQAEKAITTTCLPALIGLACRLASTSEALRRS